MRLRRRLIVDEQSVLYYAAVIQSVAAVFTQFRARLVLYGGRFGEQAHRAYLQRHEVLLIELVVVVVAVLRAEQLEVGVTDNYGARLGRHTGYIGVAVKLARVLQRLVVAKEAVYNHALQAALLVGRYVEVAHDEVGEIEPRKLEKQLVRIYGIRLVDQEERERRVAFGNERARGDGVAVVEYNRAPLPNVAYVELSAVQRPSGLYSVDYHSGHFANVTFGVFADKFLHVGQASVAVAAVELAQSAYENELVAVCSERKTLGRKRGVGRHLVKPVGLEGVVRGGI